MAHLRKQIRDAVAAAVTSLTTTGTRVFPSRDFELQLTDLPCLRVFLNNENATLESIASGAGSILARRAELVVEGVAQANFDGTLDDTLDQIALEVEKAISTNQSAGGAKTITLNRVELTMEGEAESERGVVRMTFDALYYSTIGAPDVAL